MDTQRWIATVGGVSTVVYTLSFLFLFIPTSFGVTLWSAFALHAGDVGEMWDIFVKQILLGISEFLLGKRYNNPAKNKM